MIIKDPANIRRCKVIGLVINAGVVFAALFVGRPYGSGLIMAMLVDGYSIIAGIASLLVSSIFYRWPALESVLLAFVMLVSVDIGGYTLGNFSDYESLQFINSSSVGLTLSMLIALGVVGGTIFGVSLVSRQTDQ